MKKLIAVLAVVLSGCLGYFVWPTPWRHEEANVRRAGLYSGNRVEKKYVRIHRLTGRVEELTTDGWVAYTP